MPPRYLRIGSQEAAVLMGDEEVAVVSDAGDVLLLESDSGGTDNLLLESGDNLLLEG